ncbi:unnamed protein product [Peniophora sp. CBMAI 1063]|nr:unnamed protein product [Peniophora sp. CBMAI 1063]
MGAVDPTYPLFPIASIIAAALLLVVLMTGLIRKSWNLGVFFLSFWLFLMNLANAINTIVWADNADLKLYVYCDIVSHLQIIGVVAKSTTTFIIVRRLYLIVSHQSVEPYSKRTHRWNLFVEWTLGVIFPLIVAGPVYYVVQAERFIVIQGFGCRDVILDSVLTFLLMETWSIIFPLLSIFFYYPKVVYTFYRHNRAVNGFLRSNDSVSRSTYFRVLALASIDILITFPFGLTTFILGVLSALPDPPFYIGWDILHTDWAPSSTAYSDWMWSPWASASFYFSLWTTPVLAFTIFGLFGLSGEALASYRHGLRTILRYFGKKTSVRTRDSTTISGMGTMEFGERTRGTVTIRGALTSQGSDYIIPASFETDKSPENSGGPEHETSDGAEDREKAVAI